MKCWKHLGAALLAGLFFGHACEAQSLFGSGGALSTTATSNGNAGTLTSSTPTTGGSSQQGGFSTASGGQSGSGSGGSAGLGQSSMAQPQLNMGDGSLGATIGQSGFIGRSDNSGRFVGMQNGTIQGLNNSSLMQQFSQLQNLNGNPNSQFGNAQSTVPQIRPQVQLGFEVPARAPTALSNAVESQLKKLPSVGPLLNGVTLTATATGDVTLTGAVASDNDRRLLETLVMLEPGVRTVNNQLTVAGQ